jgi:hypothetical protein
MTHVLAGLLEVSVDPAAADTFTGKPAGPPDKLCGCTVMR